MGSGQIWRREGEGGKWSSVRSDYRYCYLPPAPGCFNHQPYAVKRCCYYCLLLLLLSSSSLLLYYHALTTLLAAIQQWKKDAKINPYQQHAYLFTDRPRNKHTTHIIDYSRWRVASTHLEGCDMARVFFIDGQTFPGFKIDPLGMLLAGSIGSYLAPGACVILCFACFV